MPEESVTTTHLRMVSRDQVRPKYLDNPAVEAREVEIANPSLNHFFFVEVGASFNWTSRLGWTYQDWERYLAPPETQTWVGSVSGSPFGYFELQSRPETTEIMFFGLLRAFQGRGLGGHLLSCAVEQAWAIPGTSSVYVHTCTLDHPAALANYLARGFQVEREETEVEVLPDPEDPIWSSPDYYCSLRADH